MISNQFDTSTPKWDKDNHCYLMNEQSLSQYTNQTNYCSENKENRVLPKPDFSSIEKVANTLEFKKHGSYKKHKMLFPQTPIKSPLKNCYTPNICDKQLCYSSKTSKDKKPSACRKLDFFGNNDETYTNMNQANKENSYNFNSQLFTCLENTDEDNMSICTSKKTSMKSGFANQTSYSNNGNEDQMCIDEYYTSSKSEYEKRGKFESEYIPLKTFAQTQRRNVWKCLNINQKKICVAKRTLQLPNRKECESIKLFIKEYDLLKQSCFANYCSTYYDYWEETESNENKCYLSFSDNTFIYVLEKYYPNGDLLDFLSKLEKENFIFTNDFYWDIIFEMLCGLLHFHECGFVHFDVQPGNFLIDSNGDLKLGGFALSKPYKDLISLFENKSNSMLSIDDYFEGDFVYLAPELFNRSTIKEIGSKCDVFSLGLTILEIIGKVNLPKNGVLWQKIREPNFTLHQSFFSNKAFNDVSFVNLIQQMINSNVNQRPDILTILNDSVNFPELNKRYISLFNNSYKKQWLDTQFNHLKHDNDEERELMNMDYDMNNIQLIIAKRSNSSKFCFVNHNSN